MTTVDWAEKIVHTEWQAQNLMIDRTVDHDSVAYLNELARGYKAVKDAESVVREMWATINQEDEE